MVCQRKGKDESGKYDNSSIIQHMVFISSAFMLDTAALIPNDQLDDLSSKLEGPDS